MMYCEIRNHFWLIALNTSSTCTGSSVNNFDVWLVWRHIVSYNTHEMHRRQILMRFICRANFVAIWIKPGQHYLNLSVSLKCASPHFKTIKQQETTITGAGKRRRERITLRWEEEIHNKDNLHDLRRDSKLFVQKYITLVF